jgi:hypothetical protein
MAIRGVSDIIHSLAIDFGGCEKNRIEHLKRCVENLHRNRNKQGGSE